MSDQQEPHEPELTFEAIEASLNELVKAAEATDLVKAYGNVAVDQYGHHDERGDTSGGLAEGGDIGSLDSMMIGKMQQSLIDAGFSADQVVAFMAGKQEEEEEEEEEEGKMSGKPADTSGGVGTNPRVKASGGEASGVSLKRSMDAFRGDADIAEAIDVSPFLESLVARTAEQMDGLHKSMNAQQANQFGFNRQMAAAVYQIGQLAKSSAYVLDALNDRLGLIEAQPSPQKGHTQLSGAQPVRKSFGVHGSEGAGGERLTKGEVLATLSYMNLEKGVSDIGGTPTSQIIGLFEGGGSLAPQALDAVHGFLSAHPHEADTARTYR